MTCIRKVSEDKNGFLGFRPGVYTKFSYFWLYKIIKLKFACIEQACGRTVKKYLVQHA